MKSADYRFTTRIQCDENGESIIVFPREFCEQTDLREGDIYEMDVVDGRLVMTFIKQPNAIDSNPTW